MNELLVNADVAAGNRDVQLLTIETFEIEELNDLDISAPAIEISLCSSTAVLVARRAANSGHVGRYRSHRAGPAARSRRLPQTVL